MQTVPVTQAAADFGAFVSHGRCRRAPTGRGALDGLTFAVKDLIDVEGCRTGGGNPDWLSAQEPAARSASCVAAALAAGATFVGKTVTDELAFSLEGRNVHYADLTNPVAADRLPGGSSSGSAVAVAGGLADFALGTDTGGSVRVPANFLGYGCILVDDCCATTSPDFCTEATIWNVKKCFGFVTNSDAIIKSLAAVAAR